MRSPPRPSSGSRRRATKRRNRNSSERRRRTSKPASRPSVGRRGNSSRAVCAPCSRRVLRITTPSSPIRGAGRAGPAGNRHPGAGGDRPCPDPAVGRSRSLSGLGVAALHGILGAALRRSRSVWHPRPGRAWLNRRSSSASSTNSTGRSPRKAIRTAATC